MWLLLVAVQPACQQPSASSSSPTRYRSFKSMLPDPKGLPHFAGSGSVEKKWQIRIRKMLSDLNIADLNQNLPKFLNYLGWKRGVPSLCDRKSRHCWRTHSLRWVTVIFLKYRTVLNIKKIPYYREMNPAFPPVWGIRNVLIRIRIILLTLIRIRIRTEK